MTTVAPSPATPHPHNRPARWLLGIGPFDTKGDF